STSSDVTGSWTKTIVAVEALAKEVGAGSVVHHSVHITNPRSGGRMVGPKSRWLDSYVRHNFFFPTLDATPKVCPVECDIRVVAPPFGRPQTTSAACGESAYGARALGSPGLQPELVSRRWPDRPERAPAPAHRARRPRRADTPRATRPP